MPRIIANYPMSEYRRGVYKAGAFHFAPFEDHGPHDRLVPHRHDFFEIIWLREGRGRVVCDLRHYEFGPHTLLIFSPGQVHSWEFDEPGRGRIASFTPEFLAVSKEYPEMLAKMPFLYAESLDPILTLTPEEGARIGTLLEHFDAFVRDEAPGRDDMVRGFLVILLSLARQCFARRATPPTSAQRGEGELLVQRFRLALEERMPGVVEVGEIADFIRVSRSQLNESLRRCTGRSASEIIHDRVLLEAKRLLLHSSLTVAEIAYQLKFQDPSYFGRFFRKYTAQTPGAYRDSAQRDALVA